MQHVLQRPRAGMEDDPASMPVAQPRCHLYGGGLCPAQFKPMGKDKDLHASPRVAAKPLASSRAPLWIGTEAATWVGTRCDSIRSK